MYLSEQQRAFLQTFGFLAFPGLVADTIATITDAYEDVWRPRREAARWHGAVGTCAVHRPG